MKNNIKEKNMIDLYRYVEFGKLSSSLFHDLINPLTVISLHVEDVINVADTDISLEIKKKLATILSASKKMERLIMAIRKQLAQKSILKRFSIKEEILHTIELLSPQASRRDVSITFSSTGNISMYGNQLRFQQIMLNLISNAIDSYKDKDTQRRPERKVRIQMRGCYRNKKPYVKISVKDYGIGIPLHMQKKIFEPFFTTKKPGHGSGIGLSTTKEILEEDFRGTIKAKSAPNQGALFIVTIPL